MAKSKRGAYPKTLRLTVYRGVKSEWRWYLKTSNHRTIAASTESYKKKQAVLDNVRDAAGINLLPTEIPGTRACFLIARAANGDSWTTGLL